MPRQSSIDKSRRVTVTFDGADYEQLVKLAREHGLSVAWFVRRAVSEFIAKKSREGADALIPAGQSEE